MTEHDFTDDDDRERELSVALEKVNNALEDALKFLDRKFKTVRWLQEYTYDATLAMGRLVEQAMPFALWPDSVQERHPQRKTV